MKALKIHTLVVAVALALSGTPTMAAMELFDQPVSSVEDRSTHTPILATSTVPVYALSRLDAQTLAAQEMTEQDLKEVEGGTIYQTLLAAKYEGLLGSTFLGSAFHESIVTLGSALSTQAQ